MKNSIVLDKKGKGVYNSGINKEGITTMNNIEYVTNVLTKVVGKRLAQQIICVLLLVFGIKPIEINKKTGVALSTLRKYKKLMNREQLEELFADRIRRNVSELEQYGDIIDAEILAKQPKTLREIQNIIKERTGITRSLSRIGVWLKKRGTKIGQ